MIHLFIKHTRLLADSTPPHSCAPQVQLREGLSRMVEDFKKRLGV